MAMSHTESQDILPLEGTLSTQTLICAYRLKVGSKVLTLENSVSYDRQPFVRSKTEFDAETHDFLWCELHFPRKKTTCRLERHNSIGVYFSNLESVHTRQTILDMDPQGVPFVPFGYAEYAFLLQKLKRDETKPQIFPMLHMTGGAEFSFQNFYFAMRVAPSDPTKIVAMDFFESVLGRQSESFRFELAPNGKDIGLVNLFERGSLFGENDISKGMEFLEAFPPEGPLQEPPIDLDIVQDVEEPCELSLISPLPLETEPPLWTLVFDLFCMPLDEKRPRSLRREALLNSMSKQNIGCLLLDEFLSHSQIGMKKCPNEPTPLHFNDLKESFLTLYNSLPDSTQRKCILMGFEENAYLLPLIFANADHAPPLLLIDSEKTNFHEHVSTLVLGDDSRPEHFLIDVPSIDLLPSLKKYPGPWSVYGKRGKLYRSSFDVAKTPSQMDWIEYMGHAGTQKDSNAFWVPWEASPEWSQYWKTWGLRALSKSEDK